LTEQRGARDLQRGAQRGILGDIGPVLAFRHGLFRRPDHDVRVNTVIADGVAARGVEFGGGQSHAGLGGVQGEDSLDGTFSITALAHHRAPAKIVDRAGENLAGAGGVAVDQHDQRDLPRAESMGLVVEVFMRVPAPRGDDRAGSYELVGDFDRGGQQAARIAAARRRTRGPSFSESWSAASSRSRTASPPS